jgi:hypothetical protein
VPIRHHEGNRDYRHKQGGGLKHLQVVTMPHIPKHSLAYTFTLEGNPKTNKTAILIRSFSSSKWNIMLVLVCGKLMYRSSLKSAHQQRREGDFKG